MFGISKRHQMVPRLPKIQMSQFTN